MNDGCRPVPRVVTRVSGCSCGGMTMHATTCNLWQVPIEDAKAAIADAEQRLDDYTASLNRALHG